MPVSTGKRDSVDIPAGAAESSPAKSRKVATHIGKGLNVWSNVHIKDLVELYILALENAEAGTIFYAENGSSGHVP